jgi:hypothetical protein
MYQESFPDGNIRNVSRQIILSGAAGIEAVALSQYRACR